jgi:hypothetical protein
MKIGCMCGNVLRDQTDYIPYKAHFIADQDYYELLNKVEQIQKENAVGPAGSHSDDSFYVALTMALRHYERSLYQCNNCGRIFVDDPQDPRLPFQVFKPEDENWKKVFASVKGEETTSQEQNLVGHWAPAKKQGRIWFDPPPGAKGGYESFDKWENLRRRYFELFEFLRSQHHLVGARLGVGNEGEPIHDVHNWQPRPCRPAADNQA